MILYTLLTGELPFKVTTSSEDDYESLKAKAAFDDAVTAGAPAAPVEDEVLLILALDPQCRVLSLVVPILA